MNTQQPNDRLNAMLSGAKQIMKKVDSGDYSVGNVDKSFLDVSSSQLIEQNSVPNQYQGQPMPSMPSGPLPQVNGLPANYNNSKMPQAIKEAMLNSPQIPNYNPNHTFDLSDVPNLIEKHTSQTYRQPHVPISQPLSEGYNQPLPAGMMMVNEAQLKDMMKTYMMDFMANTFTKNLSEEVIKKTIVTLIKEGKITATTKKPANKV